ncbi:kynureninase [Marininema mesophilum]|nr:kynureninase [Marininema mesophilum]
MDQRDGLARFREEFYLKKGSIYLDGNSLGLLSRRAENSLLEMLSSWRERGIDGWTDGKHPWFHLSEQLGAQLAPLVGATPKEVIATGSTTVNLHQLLATFYQPEGKRIKIVADALTFPSDIYAMKSHVKLHGLELAEGLIQVESKDGQVVEEEALIEAMTDEVAIIVLPSVLYRSGQILNMERLTKAAHERGILIGFDLCHSIGAIPHHLSEWGVDFAFWCNYKYVNAGPGSVGGLYVNQRHHGQFPGLAGWFGSAKDVQFDMDHTLQPASHAGAFQIGTPHVLSLAPLLGSLEIFHEAGIDELRKKSLLLTRYLMNLVDTQLADMDFSFGNPLEDTRRGGHICLIHKEAVRICKALKARGVIPDYRAPNVIRLAPMALYTSYIEVWEAVERLKAIMENKEYEGYKKERGVVA